MWVIGRVGEAPVRGSGLREMVGPCGPPGRERGGRGRVADRVEGCGAGFAWVLSVYVFACSGVPVWSLVGREVRRRSLPSAAAAARMSQMSVRVGCTSCWVVGRGYCRGVIRSMRLRTLWMAWCPQVGECCGLGGGPFRVSGTASIYVTAVRMAKIQGMVPVDSQRRLTHWDRQSMAVSGGSSPAPRVFGPLRGPGQCPGS